MSDLARLPRRLVHSDDTLAITHPGAVDPVDASDRAVLDRKGERGFGMKVACNASAARMVPSHGAVIASTQL